ncbi:MAG: L-threonylcarbamoyladenylate synthase [Elainellaceae cyanobacterium]
MPQVSLDELVDIARQGAGLISFPTDTVPALATRPDAAGLIYAAKQRSESKPLILMGGNVEDLWKFVADDAAATAPWQAAAERYFPGAVTLVLPAGDRLPRAMNPTDPTTIGIRVPNHALARHLLAQTGPLATTSVNRSGEPALQELAAINEQFPDVYTLSDAALAELGRSLSVSASYAGSGTPSTVVKWTGSEWSILRQGSVVFQP